MSFIHNFLFPKWQYTPMTSALLLASRILFGLLFMSHGVAKWASFEVLASTFPDPLGVGSQISLLLAIFGELLCSAAFILGVLYRLALIPMIFTMCIAFFVVHGSDPFATKELAFLYLTIFVLLYIAGAGKYSIDYLIGAKQKQ